MVVTMPVRSTAVDGPTVKAPLSRSTSHSHATSHTLSRKFSFEAETLFYTLSEKNIAQYLKDDLESETDLATKSVAGDPFELSRRGSIASTTKEDDASRRPLDGGWGWFVALGTFMAHMIEGAFERGEGIFYLQFLERYGMSHWITTIPMSMSATLRFLLSPLASTVCNLYSIRTSTMIGAILFTVGVYLTQFADNIAMLFLTYGAIAGTGRAFFSGPGLIIIGLYFRHRQGIASGCATSGVGFGSFILVPVVQYLFTAYGFEDAFLILSAICANMILVAMLYRPLSYANFYLAMDNKRVVRQSLALVRQSMLLAKLDLPPQSDTELSTHVSASANVDGPLPKLEEPVTTEPSKETGHLRVKPDTERFCHEYRTLLCDNSWCQICFPVETFNRNRDNDAEESRMFHFYLLRVESFAMYCLTVSLFTASFKIIYMFLPTLVQIKGFSNDDSAYIISIGGLMDTLTRICVGLLVDTSAVRPHRLRLFNFLLIVLSLTSFVIPIPLTLPLIAVVMTIYACFVGMCFATRTLVLIDLLGVRRLTAAFGILMFFQAFASLLGPLLAGWMMDRFHSIYYIYFAAGVMMGVAAVCMNWSIMLHYKLSQHDIRP